MKLAKFLLNIDNEHNGHKQTSIKGLTVKQGKKILKDLTKQYPDQYFVIEIDSQGYFTIYQKDFWKSGEHPCGHVDRMILSNSSY